MDDICNNVDFRLFWTFVVDPKRDFVRKSELSFSKTMKFILGMGSRSLGSELMEFYGLDQKSVSVSAVVQRRAKILPAAFQHLFHKFNEAFSQTHFFHGYRLYAVDGSDIYIPTIPDDHSTYCNDLPSLSVGITQSAENENPHFRPISLKMGLY